MFMLIRKDLQVAPEGICNAMIQKDLLLGGPRENIALIWNSSRIVVSN